MSLRHSTWAEYLQQMVQYTYGRLHVNPIDLSRLAESLHTAVPTGEERGVGG